MRDTIEITLEDSGNELVFLIEKMPATKLQRFIMQALSLLSGNVSGASFDLQKMDTQSLLACLQGLDVDKAEPLFDALYTCAKRRVDGATIAVNAKNIDAFISDVRTLFKLQFAILKHNLGFLAEGTPSNMGNTDNVPTAENSFNMRTSHQKSPSA